MGKFKTKARAIELLGKKQLRDSITGLSEIMKNSYDADAEILRVEFNTSLEESYILIYDTGIGMSRDDFENKWLVLGTESKKVNKREKTPKGRILMGEKGIGRLAVAKLGQQTIIISKTKQSKWNMLYMNWNIFENPMLMLEDVYIPAKYDFNLIDLKEIISDLISEQITNLQNDVWYKEEYSEFRYKIENQIKDFKFPVSEMEDVCKFIEQYENHGTAVFIFNTNENWNDYLLPNKKDTDTDLIITRNYNKFASFMSDFQHVDKDFTAEVFYNGKILEFNYDYDDKDYETYDLKIEGYIEKGMFFGKMKARNADENLLDDCNHELAEGLKVTHGIKNWENYDCGKFDIKLCHVELTSKNSGLTIEEYKNITKKMAVSGGVAVYRDNVRILPYGEVENDFLGLEKRRTIHAGTYVFSHRNMFGRIDISSQRNPMLEDKSSREGLIENEQFVYFLRTIQNLLIRLAKEYITDSLKSSKNLRSTYINYNKKITEEKEKREEAEKTEKKLLYGYKKQLTDKYENYKKIFSEKKIELDVNISLLFNKYVFNDSINYSQLSSNFELLKKDYIKLKKKIFELNYLKIDIDPRYKVSLDENLISKIENHNINIFEYMTSSEKNTGEIIKIKEQEMKRYKAKWAEKASERISVSPDEYVSDIESEIEKTHKIIGEYSKELQEYCSLREDKIYNKLEFVNKINDEAKKIYDDSVEKIFNLKTVEIKSDISNLKYECYKLLDSEPRLISEKGKKIYDRLALHSQTMEEYYFDTIKHIDASFNTLDEKAELLRFYSESDNGQDTNNLIGILKEKNMQLENEIEIYSELANLGLSAEIVNHEFNQLFTNVFDAIKQLKYESLNQNSKYLLKQIEVGFRAISDRQSQLSPMYRSRSLRIKSVSVRTMVDDIYNFFREKLEDNNIEFINDISENVVRVLSLSKMYPVLSNLIYNSIFWVLDRKQRIILVHFSEEENSLYIEDSGSGIPVKFMKKIFDPFFSLKPDGRGLGLTIAKKVLENQGHTIEVVDESSFKTLEGACFRIHFSDDTTNNF